MGDLPQRVRPDPDGRYTVDVHVTPDGHARIGDHTYTPEEFADILRRNGDYDGRPVRLIGCDAGSNDFASRLSRELDTPVMAPNKPAWTDSHGRVFSSDYEIGPDGTPQPKIPPNGQWDTHHPDGTTTRSSDDGFTPDTADTDKQNLDPTDAKDRGNGDDQNSGEGGSREDSVDREANPYGVSRSWPTDPLTGQPLNERDLEFLELSEEQIGWHMRGEALLGMTPEQYKEWRSTLLDALQAEGITPNDIDVRLLGSSAEGFSGPHKPLWKEEDLSDNPDAQEKLREWVGDDPDRLGSRPFDSGLRLGVAEPSDYDTNISSDKMVEKARDWWDANGRPGEFLSDRPHKFVNKDIIKQVFPSLQRWERRWTNELGHEVSYAVFPSAGPPDLSAQGYYYHFRPDNWIVHLPGES